MIIQMQAIGSVERDPDAASPTQGRSVRQAGNRDCSDVQYPPVDAPLCARAFESLLRDYRSGRRIRD